MFGRVPRLPVDVMFRRVLDDPEVVEYDTYAKSLLSCLKSAMEIAQKHTAAPDLAIQQTSQGHLTVSGRSCVGIK